MNGMRRRAGVLMVWAVVAALLVPATLSTAAESGGYRWKVVADGLHNPRHISVGASGTVFVAEAGRGGSKCVRGEGPEGEGEFCFGRTGGVTAISGGTQRRVVSGLPSLSEAGGAFALGTHAVSFRGDGLLVAVGLGGTTRTRRQYAEDFGSAALNLGRVLRADDGLRRFADIARFETRNNPIHDPDSNTYDVLNDAGKTLVVDAGGNTLLRVRRDGTVRAIAKFRPVRVTDPFTGDPATAQAVPTSVAKGPGGAYFVGELTGFPFEKGAARIWRVVPGSKPKIVARGFTNVVDIAFDNNGRLLIVELVKNGLLSAEQSGDLTGRLVRLNLKTGRKRVIASEGLTAPGGVAVARNGDIYVSNNSVFPGRGEVIRLRRR